MSAIRPNTIAPTAEASRVAEFSHDTWVVDSFHAVSISTTTMPMTNKSYASVKKPMPETNMILYWNRLILESSMAAKGSGLATGTAGVLILGGSQENLAAGQSQSDALIYLGLSFDYIEV